MTELPLLVASGLAAARDDRWLFADLDLAISPGEIWQIVGANGAGKTTFLRILAGLLPAARGHVKYLGHPVSHCRQRYAADLLYLGHDPGLHALLTPLENLLFWQRLRSDSAPSQSGVGDAALAEQSSARHPPASESQRALAALGRTGLQAQVGIPVFQLSAGQRKRAALARLLVSDARIWLLDEAFTALDVNGVKLLESMYDAHMRRGGSVVFTSHQQPDRSRLTVRTLDLSAYIPDERRLAVLEDDFSQAMG